jgi:tetratricopeptide (TPR) repeat protein
MPKYFIYIVLLFLLACKEKTQENTAPSTEPIVQGINGETYYLPNFSEIKKQELENNLKQAITNFELDKSEENYIWYGRRLAYMYRFDEAFSVFAEGLQKFPESYKILRHRGHRYISVRLFNKAIEDLTLAAKLAEGKPVEIEPDGIPNKMNQPLSNYHFNIYYHLSLAYYLQGNYVEAEKAYEKCMQYSDNNDLKIATADWIYMTKQRLGKSDDAAQFINSIDDESEVIENDSYLQRIKMYKGKIDVNSVLNISATDPDMELKLATQGYGVANWYLQQKDTTKTLEIIDEILKGTSYTAFGFIAAETDLNKLTN